MKATGIVRRIDELGRVVIPKEIRRTFRIREGDALEIFTNGDGGVVLKKYSPVGELSAYAREYAESLRTTVPHTIAVADRDAIVAVAGPLRRQWTDKGLSAALETAMNERVVLCLNRSEGKRCISLVEGDEPDMYKAQVIVPIVSAGDVIGAVMMVSEEANITLGEVEIKLTQTAASFLGQLMLQ